MTQQTATAHDHINNHKCPACAAIEASRTRVPTMAAPSTCKNCGCERVRADLSITHVPCLHSMGGPGGVLYQCLICDAHCS